MCRVVVARGEGCLLSGTSCVSTVRKRRRRKGRRISPAFSVIRSSPGALERLAYSDERIRFEGRSADETAVHIGFCEEFLGVGGFARAAVEYRGGVGGSAEFFGQRPTDVGVHLFSLFRCSRFAGTYRPYGFVGYDERGELFGCQVIDHLPELCPDDVEVPARFAFFELFAHAVYRNEVVGVCMASFRLSVALVSP